MSITLYLQESAYAHTHTKQNLNIREKNQGLEIANIP